MNATLSRPTASLERVLLAALLGMFLLEALLLGFSLSEGMAGRHNAALIFSSALAAGLCLLAAQRSGLFGFWGGWALALSSWTLGGLLGWPHEASELLSLACALLALLAYPHRIRGRALLKFWLDVGILGLALLTLLGFGAALGPQVIRVDGGHLMLIPWLLSALLMLALRRVGEAPALELLLLALAVALGLMAHLPLAPPGYALLEGVQFMVFGWAAYQGRGGLRRPDPLDFSRFLNPVLGALPYLLTVVSLLIALYAQAQEQSHALLLALGAALVVLLTLARQALTLLENRTLLGQVHEAHHTRQSLLESLSAFESRYQSLVENSSDLVQILTPLGRVSYVSPSHRERLGFEPSELLEQSSTLLLHPEDFANFRQMLHLALTQRGLTAPVLYRVRHKSGGWRWLEAVAKAMLEVENIGGIVVNARDVTEREDAQEKMRSMSKQLEVRLERITALHTIDLSISSRLPLRVTLEMVLAQVNTHLGVEASAIRLRDRSSGLLNPFCALGFKNEAAREHLLALGQRWADNVVLEGKPLGTRLAVDPTSSWATPSGGIRYFAAPLLIEGQARGVLEVYQKGDARREREWHNFLETLSAQAALALENDTLLSDLERRNRELTAAYNEVIEGWARALDLRDKETEGHSRRVTDLAVRLAVRMGLEGEALVHLRRGALLHDIGKMGIPDRILLKPGPLDPEEWTVMRTHPELSYALLSPIEFLRPALDIPLCHHEKWDGKGYPQGLRGLDIPLAARIFAVVDVWDALTSDRPYHARRTPSEALSILLEGVGQHFDPEVVRAFLTLEEIVPLHPPEPGQPDLTPPRLPRSGVGSESRK